jgi:hypothetical protein
VCVGEGDLPGQNDADEVVVRQAVTLCVVECAFDLPIPGSKKHVGAIAKIESIDATLRIVAAREVAGVEQACSRARDRAHTWKPLLAEQSDAPPRVPQQDV